MLTEEMLAALIQALKGVHRLILIGDPRQLPPIGAGRPFVDIVKHLAPEGVTEKFPRVGPGYAELTIRRRQAGEDREDLQLAEWFSGSPIAAGEDDVFDKVVRTGQRRYVLQRPGSGAGLFCGSTVVSPCRRSWQCLSPV